jgi:peptidoglycan hydrolase CwlO-like protein
MKKRIILRLAAVVAVLVTFCFLTSCQSKEEKVISQLESLCKTVERDGFNVKDIDSVQARFEAIHESAKECNFTNEQLKEVAKLDARFTKAVAKKAIERVGNALDGIVEGLSGDN